MQRIDDVCKEIAKERSVKAELIELIIRSQYKATLEKMKEMDFTENHIFIMHHHFGKFVPNRYYLRHVLQTKFAVERMEELYFPGPEIERVGKRKSRSVLKVPRDGESNDSASRNEQGN